MGGLSMERPGFTQQVPGPGLCPGALVLLHFTHQGPALTAAVSYEDMKTNAFTCPLPSLSAVTDCLEEESLHISQTLLSSTVYVDMKQRLN